MPTNKIVKVYHIPQPKKYFSDEIQNKPIFGISNFYNQKLIPLKLECSGRSVIYTTKEMQDRPDAPLLRDTVSKDEYEYFKMAQLEMANKFFDTIAYRQENGQYNYLSNQEFVYLSTALQHFIYASIKYFDYFIDFNEMNRISLLPIDQAMKEFYPLFLAIRTCTYREVISRSLDKKDYMPKAREWFLDSLKMRNPPRTTAVYMNDYYEYYKQLNETTLRDNFYTPWDRRNDKVVDVKELEQTYKKLRYPEPQQQTPKKGFTTDEILEMYKEIYSPSK